MSASIDERVVSMKFDNSKFEANAEKTMSTLDKLKRALKFDKASDGLENVSKAVGNIKLDGVGAACETVSAKFSALQIAAITALSNITNDAVNAGKRIVSALTIDGARDGFAEYEEKMGSVQTIMNGTGESLETVMGYLEELNRYADQTIYSFSDMTSSIGKFTNAGVDLKTSVAAIQGISNAVALSGGAADKASMAMYNFAQALSIGYVGLTDWKSIELSGMATLDFKQQVMDTAVELGTLRKEADGTYKTIEKGTEVTAEGMRETLKQQWFTSDVLTTVLAKYADQTTELGQKATEAATKVKTFSMMIDTLKEGIGSGWAVTWEKLIGDFNQASDLFTNATNAIQNVIDAQADARNKFIDAAFNTGRNGVIKDANDWTKLAQTVRNAGGDVGKFKNVIIDVARTHGVEIDKMIQEAGNFNDTLQNGWLSSDILKDAVSQAEALGSLSPEFSGLAKAVSLTNKPFRDFLEEIDEVSGRVHVINGIKNIFEGLKSVIAPIKDAFRQVFPPKTGEDLKNTLEGFENFTEKLKLSEEVAERVKNTFQGFFTVIKKGLDTIKSVAQAFSPITDIFSILIQNLLLGAESLGGFFNTLDEGETSVSGFQKVLNFIHDSLQLFANNLQGYIDKSVDAFKRLKNTVSQSWDTGALSIVATAVEKIKNALSGFSKGAGEGFRAFFDSISKGFSGNGFEKVTSVLSAFAEGIGKVANALGSVLKPLIEKLKEFFTNIDILDSLGYTLGAGGIAAVGMALRNFVDGIADTIKKFQIIKNPIDTVAEFTQKFGEIFDDLEEAIRINVVKEFAVSVGILAAAIYALASIDPSGARQAVGILTLLMAEVLALFKVLEKLSTKTTVAPEGFFGSLTSFKNSIASFIGQGQQAAALMAMVKAIQTIATALLILAAAMKVISTIPFPEMAASFIALSLLLWEIVGVMKVLSTNEKTMISGSGAMITLATTINMLAVAMKIIASIGIPELIASGIALTVLITELVTVCKLLEGSDGIAGAGSMIALASAILILSAAMKVMASMSFEEISRGLFAVAGVLLELGVALKLMPEAIPGAQALLIASAAIMVLAGALKLMSSIGSESILPTLGLLAGVLLELGVALYAMKGSIVGAQALIIAAGAIAVLVPALLALSAAKPEKVFIAIIELALGLTALAGISALLAPLAPAILAFAGAIAVLGAALLAIGAGVALAGVGLTAFATSLGLFAEIGKESAERIVEALNIILKGVISLIPNAIAAIGEGIIDIIEVFNKAIPTVRTFLSNIFGVIIDVIGEHIPNIVDVVVRAIVLILQSLADNIPAMIQAGIDIMVAFIRGIQETQNQVIEAAMQAMIAFINGLADSIRANTPLLIDAVHNLMSAVLDSMLLILGNGRPEFVIKAKELMESFKAGIIEKFSIIMGAVRTMVNNCINVIKEKVSGFKAAAGNLMDGFIQGIKEKVSGAIEAVSSFGSECLNKLKSILDIHSPSKATEQIGKYFGEGFAKGVDQENNAAAESSESLANSATESMNSAIDAMLDRINARSQDFKKVGGTMMEQFAIGIQESISTVQESLNDTFTALFTGVNSKNTSAQTSFKTIMDNIIGVIKSYYNSFFSEGQYVTNRFMDGSKSRTYYVITGWNVILQQCISNIRNKYYDFYSTGGYVAEGFADGIRSKIDAAARAAAEMAKAASEAAKKNLDIHSPSRVFAKIGEFAGQGFINGLANYNDLSENAGMTLAMRAVKAASEMIDDGIDTNPVITPVIDLSNVEEGTRRLSAMLSADQAITVNTDMNRAAMASLANSNQNGANQPAPQTTFIQNNYSPKALSRIEIYRQTNNQLSRMNGALV